jgi:FkbM family methyltransferase
VSLKDSVRGSLRQLGWDVKRFNSLDSEWARLAQLLSIHRVNVVFDVGANTGQFARNLLDSSFNGRIISFEPLSSAHRELERRARGKTNWTIAPRVAIGDRDGKALINVAENSVSSSMLPIRETHVHAEATSRYVMTEEVDLRQLDTIAPEYAKASDRVFLKVDVQGFEYQVLQGATQFLSKVVGIQMELSLISLYEGDHLLVAMLHEMESRGFGLWSLIPGFVDPSTGRLLQVDGVFVKTSLPEPSGLVCISTPAMVAP